MNDTSLTPISEDDPLRRALAHTPARLATGRAGPAYRTGTWLKLREDHAAARDAVHAELDLMRDFGTKRIEDFQLFNTCTLARSRADYLMRPDLGRRLDEESRERLRTDCPKGRDLQIVIGDGLSATAVATQAPFLLDSLRTQAEMRGWSFGRPFLVNSCRVGVINDVGDLLSPKVVVLLIGERPGLATAESLSAYLAYRPHSGHTDGDRNLISNIHAGGISIPEAAERIALYAARMIEAGTSGVLLKECSGTGPPRLIP
ncbi:MAG TPA: ethanolamine ammonia-lyase subunit EutC [Fimbriiglobus sp.]|jgi:ethanolamine ammonia-lyase small subunit